MGRGKIVLFQHLGPLPLGVEVTLESMSKLHTWYTLGVVLQVIHVRALTMFSI